MAPGARGGHGGAHRDTPAGFGAPPGSEEHPWSRAEAVARSDGPGRIRRREAEELWDLVGLAETETVVEVGAGVGDFSFPAARRVGPHGCVYAVDVSRDLLGVLTNRLAGAGPLPLTGVQSTPDRIPLASRIADVVLLANLFCDAPAGTIREAVRLLKVGGRFVVVDWERRASAGGPPVSVRLSRARARAWLLAAGLHPVAERAFGRSRYILVATRSSPARPGPG